MRGSGGSVAVYSEALGVIVIGLSMIEPTLNNTHLLVNRVPPWRLHPPLSSRRTVSEDLAEQTGHDGGSYRSYREVAAYQC